MDSTLARQKNKRLKSPSKIDLSIELDLTCGHRDSFLRAGEAMQSRSLIECSAHFENGTLQFPLCMPCTNLREAIESGDDQRRFEHLQLTRERPHSQFTRRQVIEKFNRL